VYALALIAGVFPLLVILVTAALITRSFWDAHNGVLGLALSLGLTVTFTDIVKVSPGGTRFGRRRLLTRKGRAEPQTPADHDNISHPRR
jgi:hypothetical protein